MQADLFGGSIGRTDAPEILAELEVDYTPPAVALQLLLALVRALADLGVAFEPHHALDPAAGSGCWGRAMRAIWPDMHIFGADLRRSEGDNLLAAYDDAMIGDATEHLNGKVFDLVATNPPFSAFEAFWPGKLLRQHMLSSDGVVALLGLSQWGQSAEAQGLLERWSPALQLRLGGRPAFREDGKTDSREYSLWVWARKLTDLGRRPRWRVEQLPALPLELRRWSPAAVPGTYPIDPALVAEVRRYLGSDPVPRTGPIIRYGEDGVDEINGRRR